MIKIELRNGPNNGQQYDVPANTETVLVAINAKKLTAGCYIYGDKKTYSDDTISFRYLGTHYGIVLKSSMESSPLLYC